MKSIFKALTLLLAVVTGSAWFPSSCFAVLQIPACDAICDETGNAGQCFDPCFHPPIPGMFGDGGLVNPRLSVVAAGVQVPIQNHIYKVTENNSALPQNRIGFNINALADVYSGQDDGGLNDTMWEYRLFAEKTFADGLFSLEFMVPFYTSSSRTYEPLDLVINGPGTDNIFGNIAFGMKTLLHQSYSATYSMGLRVEAPTGDDIVSPPPLNFFYSSFEDDVWYFTPYFATLWTPSDRLFFQSFLSYRLNTAPIREVENPVTIREQTYLMVDTSVGYWIVRNRDCRGLTGLASMLELHYTGAYDRETSNIGRTTVTDRVFGSTDHLNLTAGITATFGQRFTGGISLATPLRSNSTQFVGTEINTDRSFDWAVITNMTYHY